MTTTKMHELIDREDPVCLYCGAQCEVFLSATQLPHSSLMEDQESLTCISCKEEFMISSLQNPEGDTNYTGFTFTCQDYLVFVNYLEDYFEIKDKNGKYIIALPSFNVDFSDKNKLREKLKTYIIFS